LWSLLIDGRSGQGDVPSSRFDKDAFYHADPDRAGALNGSGGYFLQHDIKLFDNLFFGIHNLEARYMDPQQRQLLEVVYECLENAGESLESVSGANVGCYVANFTFDHAVMQAKDPDQYHRYSATGFGPTILANRISHTFNLKGPSFVLDTACSSSLYALHMACTALNAGECDAAIVAGANLVQSPEVFIAMAKAGVLSASSTSHTFDVSADGYGRGEGVAALYLRRLEDVLERGPVRSVIRGTAVNR
jgi:acyl transferase domain-containing protein